MTTPDRRPALYEAYEQAARALSLVSPSDLARQTPCPAYDMATLVDHVVGAAERAAALGRGEQPGPEDFPHVELEEAADLVRRSGKEAQAAWADDARLAATVTMPWGETYTGATLVDMYLAELAAHAWDVSVSVGRQELLDPALAGPALTGARAMLKPDYRNVMGEGNPYGSEVEPPADATDWERLAAFMGREPRPGKAG